uniref:Uncharacterized protein n=1 Tax=Triticum urartu TaxID=4572 RepID=A0A8R7P5F4_TRIUA
MTSGPERRFVTTCTKSVGGVGEIRTMCLMNFFLHDRGVELTKSRAALAPKLWPTRMTGLFSFFLGKSLKKTLILFFKSESNLELRIPEIITLCLLIPVNPSPLVLIAGLGVGIADVARIRVNWTRR